MIRVVVLTALVGIAGGNQALCSQVALPENPCPSDRIDGPVYENGIANYGIPARRVVDSFLAPPNDSFGRVHSGTQNVDRAMLRILANATDAAACRRLTYYLSNGTRSSPPSGEYVYFTAGGFYFVAPWRRAMTLSNYTTGYSRVMVFDNDFNLLGAYAF